MSIAVKTGSKMPEQVSIIVLAYNSREHLPALFESLAAQTYPNIQVVVVDNASSDETLAWVQRQDILKVDILANETNDWYAKGNNAGIQLCTGEYIVFCNDDVALEPTCIAEMVQVFTEKPQAGMVGGKLLKMHTDDSGKHIIDSAGLVMHRSRKVVNRGENLPDTGQFETYQKMFGITGALMMISRSAYTTVSIDGECFDNDYVAYKEDVDLSWRMWRHGLEVWYQPQAVAYHARSIQQASLAERTTKPEIIRAYSYRNHIWTLLKNERLTSFVKDAWAIVPYEIAKLLYILFREPKLLRTLSQIMRGIPTMRRKRAHAAKLANDPIRSWIQ